MEYRTLGRSGVAVSELCLGTMTFGRATEEAEAIRMMHKFFDDGGNFLDTADTYVGGRSEEIVGQAIQGRRKDIVLASKVRMRTSPGVNGVGYSRKHVMDSIDESLKRLKTDYLDLYQLHVWDHLTPIEEVMRTLDDLITQGKVRYIGCSNFLSWQLMKALSVSEREKYAKFISLQPQYSLIHREMDREMMSLIREEGIGFLPWAPLGGGLLTDKYERNERPERGRLAAPKVGEYTWDNKATPDAFRILDEVVAIAEEIHKTPAQVALNWQLGKEEITAPIVGCRTMAQYEENIGAVGWRLSKEHQARLDEVSAIADEYPNRFIERFSRPLTPEEK
ncbi:aryl-alcohol dehydrogenase-like predicted oxidoreductase [Salsuginibacillus halophilus]|uniref:Aryl-alcohol dehydrogenase-like predicted oxidoreductase n=1 Tax=Salsuginibacillus halophilus TaxID=517424 RepID=A0A2P8HYF6_9BACI|nr:aldo/keto reductase [Salsuginibacillus halophilus]PSL51278.1 aryl-alcohol dehydrogenase-like predicted oxidoreductase [Salsuginibacillus halophilus]